MRLNDQTLRRLAWVAAGIYVVTLILATQALYASLEQTRGLDAGERAGSGLAPQGTVNPRDFVVVGVFGLFPLVGLLITRRLPRNRVGWLLLAIGVGWSLGGLLDAYVRWALILEPGSLPAGVAVQAVGAAVRLPPVALTGIFLILLFPDGLLPSRRWRPVAWLGAFVVVVGVLSISLTPGPIEGAIAALGKDNPLGMTGAGSLLDALFVVSVALLPVCILASATALVLRYRRSRGEERLQLKWLTTAGAFVAAAFLLSILVSLVSAAQPDDSRLEAWSAAADTVAVLSFGLIPIAIGVAVLRHGLYGIDAIISRALMVGVLGVFITGVYVAIVVGIGALIGQQGPSVALSVVATAVVAVAFQPVRERVQRWVNRLVYGERATPYEVLADFASRVTGRYTTAELLPRLAETVSEGLGGARVEVWVRTGDELAREVCRPAEPIGAVPPVPASADGVAMLVGDRVVPVRHRDELLGVLAVTKPAGEAITPPEDAMLEQVATQAGLVLRNLRLIDDLKGSRVRLVASQDAERRRLERNLHDGAQQSLVSVALLTRMAAARASDPDLKKSLSEAGEQLQAAINELRELARGIHPVVLTERGLGPALTSLAERSTVPVIVETDLRDRLPESVEATLYLVAAEAIRNAGRHAGARTVRVRVTPEDRAVALDVVDDDPGGADPTLGAGLQSLTDRVAAVDGVLDLTSSGDGTRITCRIPVTGLRSAVLEGVS